MSTVETYVPPDLGLPYFGLTERHHTNCCGVKVLVPTFYSPYLAEDFNNVIGSRPGRYYSISIYGKKVYYANNDLRARAKREEVTAAFREGLKDLRAGQMVKVFFVPAYLLTEVAELIEAHKDKKYFRMTRQIKTGAFYVLSTGVI
jgi:hypothetical protein